ncbi:hypothetical protein Adi01nite_37420 [Amorphoplanes digitatis]|uniref:Uncharacterized protein n=1 Tax=Actinoplanes digitatis TaxID=1868 RepID=A0A7W7HTR9_9ACTN|nr:hypothetical protein [Actinoplanes digitatis]MBB4760648.1 hypothetical protein [Actinoplanes digitatis]GID94330.1 hypothetical protein Adi01nite_37420 [Actinoplanes digitatis]
MRFGPHETPSDRPSWFEPAEPAAPPRRPALTASAEPSRIAEWAAARCDEIVGDIRGGLWRFTEGVADVLFPGIGPAVGSARRATKWGPTLVGLNDGRGSDVKIGLIGSENLGLWAVLRCRLGQSDHGPRPGWCADLPLGPLGAEGIRAGAVTISAIEDVKPADVAPLLLAEPAVGAETRLLLRVDVPGRSGVVAVDAGDGVWQRRIFFTLLHPARRGAGHHETYRVVCPVCGRRRLAQFRGFDVCSDCGWLHTQP